MEERNLPAKKNSGVYKITSPTGKIYIGKSTLVLYYEDSQESI